MATNATFEVPNTEEGRYFLHLLKKFSLDGISWKKFGRKRGVKFGEYVRLSEARWFAVYSEIDGTIIGRAELQQLNQLLEENSKLRRALWQVKLALREVE